MLAVQRALVCLKLRKVTRFAIISLYLVAFLSLAAPEAASNSKAMRTIASGMCDPGSDLEHLSGLEHDNFLI